MWVSPLSHWHLLWADTNELVLSLPAGWSSWIWKHCLTWCVFLMFWWRSPTKLKQNQWKKCVNIFFLCFSRESKKCRWQPTCVEQCDRQCDVVKAAFSPLLLSIITYSVFELTHWLFDCSHFMMFLFVLSDHWTSGNTDLIVAHQYWVKQENCNSCTDELRRCLNDAVIVYIDRKYRFSGKENMSVRFSSSSKYETISNVCSQRSSAVEINIISTLKQNVVHLKPEFFQQLLQIGFNLSLKSSTSVVCELRQRPVCVQQLSNSSNPLCAHNTAVVIQLDFYWFGPKTSWS